MKVMVVFGTRPEAVKLAPVIQRLKTAGRQFKVVVCVTGQHVEMLEPLLKYFEVRPEYHLGVMKKSQSLFHVTAKGLERLKGVLEKERPDLVLVQGDTTTAFAAALAAYYLRIKIGHVEAGVRTGDKYCPFPEELNRRLIDVLADLHFAATREARANLLREGIDRDSIFVTGNTGIDTLLMTRKEIRRMKWKELDKDGRLDPGLCRRINRGSRRMILVTGHRRESFGPALESICHGLKSIVEKNDDVELIYPVHLNPNVRRPVREILGRIDRIHLLEPVDYPLFVWLMDRAYLILTDSGGVQEEAPSLGKPVLVMREKTDRPESIRAGTAKLAGTAGRKIFAETQRLLDDKRQYAKMSRRVNPFGDGHASARIAGIIRGKVGRIP